LAAAVALHSMAFGVERSRRLLRFDPRTVIGVGMATVILSGVAGLIVGRPFLTGLWGITVPVVGKLSTVLLFDVGVFLVVVGTTSLALFTLEEED
jgi:multicomponent Na+:H+ antiporter subunit B